MSEGTIVTVLRNSDAARAVARFSAISAVALAVFAAILMVAGKDPLAAYADTFRHTLASAYGFSELLVRMTPARASCSQARSSDPLRSMPRQASSMT